MNTPRIGNADPYRHPGGRTCPGAVATITAVVIVLTMPGKKVGAR